MKVFSDILSAYINSILAGRFASLTKEQILGDIQNGRFIELRDIIFDAFEADELIKLHLEELGSHPELEMNLEKN
ncbi:hypothetical protein [Bacillus massiliigorillae]|uniref:hypothetical protein n=1 Tax=Bacillus massiliigorillae TaxID=1243664 RepID=UPI0003A93139|nr:hypothetical protein [Bacillus massiliigorillae]